MILIPTISDPVLKSAGGTSYTLINAICDWNIDESDDELLTSVINGDRTLLQKGNYFNGEIDYYRLSVATYVALKALKGTLCRLWPFGQGAIGQTTPQYYYPYVDVLVTQVKPYHRESKYYIDACIISVVSHKYYTLVRATDTGEGGGS